MSIQDDILIVSLHPGMFDVEKVNNILDLLDQYLAGRQYLTVIDCEKGARTTLASLRRMAQPSSMQYSIAKAYVIHTFHQRLMANLYRVLFQPVKPVRFFRNLERARTWLEDLAAGRVGF